MSEKAYGSDSELPILEVGKLHLYNMRFCPYAARVKFVLTAMNIPHETININLTNKPEWFLEKCPSGKVPAIEQDGKFLYESLIITEYLNDAYPNKLYPEDPYVKAREKIFLEMTGQFLSPVQKCIEGSLNSNDFWPVADKVLMAFETELKKRGTVYFGGSQPNILDYVIWPTLKVMLVFDTVKPEIGPFPKSKYPNFSEWIDNISTDPVIQLFNNTKLIASYLKSRINGNPDYDLGL